MLNLIRRVTRRPPRSLISESRKESTPVATKPTKTNKWGWCVCERLPKTFCCWLGCWR
ncbi:protein of unknown function [Nitrospina watsonii]|uniref:Uncharacterized protein n=1 Tax=Nitrospina watsonii TaxID=1323948 RepID=A0ABM9HBJ3_9BACT|nr:protein of unknown function [Nitrospina watsonii]